jgi:acylaminoacyl-peptidase
MHVPYAPAAAGAADTAAAAAPTAARLCPELLSAATPVFSPDGQQLLFLSHEAAARSGVHNATAALHSLPWPQVGSMLVGPCTGPTCWHVIKGFRTCPGLSGMV